MKHALLGASKAYEWANCTPSARLAECFPEEISPYAQEGTLAHAVGEIQIRMALKKISKDEYSKMLKDILSNPLYNNEMLEHVGVYVEYCMELAKQKGAYAMIEKRLDFGAWVKEGFGTSDFTVIKDGVLEIVDLKYGKGVMVSSEGNYQMRLYALGALFELEGLYKVDKVRMTIVQPRMDNISTAEMTVDELMEWGRWIKPIADKAWAGEGEYKEGKWCKFCKARHTCRARADENMKAVLEDFKAPELLSEDEVLDVLNRSENAIKWLQDIQDYCYAKAVSGEKIKGWKLVQGRSIRVISDEIRAGSALIDLGFDEDQIYQKSLIKLGEMEKLVGKKRFAEISSDFISKKEGKPALVVESDKREEFSSVQNDFKN